MRPLVLVYTNDAAFAFSVRSILTNCGFYSSAAVSLEEAKSRVNFYPPHVCLVDYDSDRTFLEQIWNSKRLQNIPVVLMAARESYNEAKGFSKTKFAGVVSKPIDEKSLGQVILSFFNRAKIENPVYLKFDKEQLQKTSLKIEGRVSELSEAGFTMESGVKFTEQILVKLRSRIFINVGFDPPYSILFPKGNIKHNYCDGSFVGLKEDEAVLIRAWINKRLTRKGD